MRGCLGSVTAGGWAMRGARRVMDATGTTHRDFAPSCPETSIPSDCVRREAEEARIWVKVRCWGRLTLEEAVFFKGLDRMRGYTGTPEWICSSLRVPEEHVSRVRPQRPSLQRY